MEAAVFEFDRGIDHQIFNVVREQNFVRAFPTAAFTARIAQDGQSRIPNAGGLASFLAANPSFDLLQTRIGAYFQTTPAARAAAASAAPSHSAAPPAAATVPPNPDLVTQLRKTQRIFKLSPTYSSTNILLGDNLDSAHKIYRMGRNNFVAKYGPKLGAGEAQTVFDKALQTHSLALALTGCAATGG